MSVQIPTGHRQKHTIVNSRSSSCLWGWEQRRYLNPPTRSVFVTHTSILWLVNLHLQYLTGCQNFTWSEDDSGQLPSNLPWISQFLPSGKHTKSYWTWPLIVSFPIKHGDFPWLWDSLPEGTTISHHFCWSIPGETTIEPPSDSPCTTTVTALSRGRAFGAISHPSHIPCNAKEGLVSRKLSHIKLLMTYPIKLTINVISISENVVFSLQNRWIVDHSYSWRFPMTVRLSYGMSKFKNWLQQCKLNTSTHQGSFWNWWNFYPFISSLCYFHLISRASFWCSTTCNSNTSKTWGERQTNLGRGRLVVSTPLKNISQLGVIISNIYVEK